MLIANREKNCSLLFILFLDWVMKPFGFEEGKKYPTIIEIHGGPHVMYANTYFHEFQTLAAKGVVVVFTNPRGSHGYGQAFVDAVRGKRIKLLLNEYTLT